MSELLRIFENEVQLFALTFMALVYALTILWVLRFRQVRERTFPAGSAITAGFLSLASLARPWAMESTRKNLGLYFQFVVFHVGIAAAIMATFIIPYFPHLFDQKITVTLFRFLIAAAFLTGLVRLSRRIFRPYPLARFILGRSLGHRGVTAVKRHVSSASPPKG